MSQAVKAHDVERTIRSTVVRLFGEDVVDRVELRRPEDPMSDDTLFVTIFLKADRGDPPASRLGDTIVALSESLKDVGVKNFPFVTFVAPGYEHAQEDARPAA